MNHHRALDSWLRMIFSENRFTLFRIVREPRVSGPLTGDAGAVRPSLRRALRSHLDRWQRLVVNLGLEAAQPLIDRDQLDDRAPCIDEVLKRATHFRERTQGL